MTDAYIACWKDESRSTSPDCALESVAIARSQGRTEDVVSELLGSMGIFEKGCAESDNDNVKAYPPNPRAVETYDCLVCCTCAQSRNGGLSHRSLIEAPLSVFSWAGRESSHL